MRRTASSGYGGDRLDRVTTVLLLAVVTLTLVGFANSIREPYSQAREMERRAGAARERVAALETENAALAEQIHYLGTARGLEVEARRHRFTRPWETPVRVVFERTGDTGP